MNLAADFESSGETQLLLYAGVRELLLEEEISSAHLRYQCRYCVTLYFLAYPDPTWSSHKLSEFTGWPKGRLDYSSHPFDHQMMIYAQVRAVPHERCRHCLPWHTVCRQTVPRRYRGTRFLAIQWIWRGAAM